MSEKQITVALAGNPNSGKTTVFNALTGARQHVGNYPGVTVEKKEGVRHYKGYQIRFVDLPGIYSLTAHSLEEIVARDFLIDEQPEVVVNILDASNFERNLYLTTQIHELKVPMVIALNMADAAEKRGIIFDTEQLGLIYDAEAVLTVGTKARGLNELLDAIIKKAHEKDRPHRGEIIRYGNDIEAELNKIETLVNNGSSQSQKYDSRWLSLKLLEQDQQILGLGHNPEVIDTVANCINRLEKIYADRPEILIAEQRYGFVSGVYEKTVKQSVEQRHQISDSVDKILLNRVLGLPIFLGMMYLVFKLTFWAGEPAMGWIEAGFGWLGDFITGLWPAGSQSAIKSLLVDGIIGGVGGVVVFLPNIILLFLAIAILEDSGYMARAAFLMDRIMKKVGLQGRSFIPMMIGFGCSVPAIMGTRIIDDHKSRLTTILILPLMSCGARLPIYVLIIPAFFAAEIRGLMMWTIYLIGIILALLLSLLLRKFLLQGKSSLFLMELPPYRMPTLRGIMTHMWQRSWLYLQKAGTIILAISIVLWALTSYPKIDEGKLAGLSEELAQQETLQYSIAGRIGTAMEPIIKPMGFDYRIGTALIGALAAKEVFVAQMGIVFSIGEADESSDSLKEKLQRSYTPLQGFCIMLFCLISAPCVATLAICKHETNSWKWALFQFGGLTAIAYVITVAVYQVGSILIT